MLFNNGPNIVTFQLAMGDERRAWDACPPGCKPIVLGDLNINFRFPRDEQEEVIVDLLDEINLIDTLHRYRLQMPLWASTRAWWTWSQKRQETRHYTQPDYFLARAEEMAHFKGVGFRSPSFSTQTIVQ